MALVGRPNTGKSTFLNTVLQTHLAPVSAKPQTTRRRLLGVWSGEGGQILFLDTPGVFQGASELDRAMGGAVQAALADADAVLCLVDPLRPPGAEDAQVAAAIHGLAKPVLVGLNKADLASPGQLERAAAWWRERLPAAPQFRFAATRRETLDAVLAALAERLPRGPFLFDPEDLTDQVARVLGAELIRETVLEALDEEVPHAVAVEIDQWREEGARTRIRATLHVEREAHKPILIGAAGRMIRQLTRQSEPKLAELCGGPVKLQLFVKVTEKWRQRRDFLERLGLHAGRRPPRE
ncbi:MAG: GTPase Era [Lentisphaeria bacterium]